MRVATWNVNSLTARLERVLAFLEDVRPDVLLIQETKVSPDAFPHLPLQAAGYTAVDHSGGRWEGVAILARHEFDVSGQSLGLPGEPSEAQSRWVEATVDGVRYASVYVPNGRALGTETFAEKLRFLEVMADRAGSLGELAIVGGDMNVCPTDLDVWDPAAVHGSTHITPDERSRLNDVLHAGFVDSFRSLHPTEPGFTWWDYRAGHFHKGFGLRIDLLLVSDALAGSLTAARVERDYRKPSKVPGTKPSDHAPLVVELG
ncbi:MAG TPA: exodeoxyribonuclease III [Acidimicrobiia bacterium]|nr:exodeoxyribonuclease III [Acidimicrobiia bacterium]